MVPDGVNTGLRIDGLLQASFYSMTGTTTRLLDGTLFTEVTDSLGQRFEKIVDGLSVGAKSNCTDDATCEIVGVGVGVGGALACASLVVGGPIGFLAGLTCGLIATVMSVGVGTVCGSLQPGCNFGASLSVAPVCRDWYCSMTVLGVNNKTQPFRESHTILSWRRSDGTDAYIQGHIATRHAVTQPSPDDVQIITQNFEIRAPRDTVRCTTEVWMYTHGRWAGETVTSPQIDAPKINGFC